MKELTELLKSNGFIRTERGQIHFEKQCDVVRCHVDERPGPNGTGRKGIRLGISINDPFREDEHRGLSLSGLITNDGVVFDSAIGAMWWDPATDSDAICRHFEIIAWDWFEKYTKLDNLIDYFYRGLHEGLPTQHHKPGIGLKIAHYLLFRGDKFKAAERRYPPIYSYYLSLLYLHRGNVELAKEYTKRYLEHLSQSPGFGSEPERTRRQMEFLETQSTSEK